MENRSPVHNPRQPSDPRRRTSGPAVLAIIAGAVFVLLGAGGLTLGGAASIAGSQNGADGYLISETRSFATDSYALTSPTLELVIDEPAIARTPFDLGDVRLQAEAVGSDKEIFIGVGAQADVDRFLDDVPSTAIESIGSFPDYVRYEDKPGTSDPTNPTAETFWVASASGEGLQEIVIPVHSGEWVVVVMNADASPGVATNVQAGYRSDQVGFLPIIALLAGTVLFLLGVGLILLGAAGAGRRLHEPESASVEHSHALLTSIDAGGIAYPAGLHGELDTGVSRGLWLVKWMLAVPHLIILFFLWLAFTVTTVFAGFAILFTGRYPRSLFDFNVGVLRWNWRVVFYAYSALATDRYPPFTLASTDYPADLQVAYPQRLSRGLVLIKWWLLAIPHLLILAVFTGAGSSWVGLATESNPGGEPGFVFSLLGILILIAGLMLLFTGTYRHGLFNLIMGINRWIFRVTVYVALMRDEYPPFRLDQGPDDPAETVVRPSPVGALS